LGSKNQKTRVLGKDAYSKMGGEIVLNRDVLIDDKRTGGELREGGGGADGRGCFGSEGKKKKTRRVGKKKDGGHQGAPNQEKKRVTETN